jgi:hypothetical protein
MRRVAWIAGLFGLGLLVYLAGAVLGLYGREQGAGEVTRAPIPAEVVAARAAAQAELAQASGAGARKQVLFGDLHVHTTFSTDAFLWSLPAMSGEGAHPLADACDFARYCSALDFWSINDHSEALTPRKWQETKESIRQCNAVGGDAAAPDVMAFLGWEWTQIGRTADEHWGHKNVVLRETEDSRVPARPINSGGFTRQVMAGIPLSARLLPALFDFGNRQNYYDWDRFAREVAATTPCAEGVHVKELPADCVESAETPGELFEKLAQWDVESLVIPHGTTWGIYTPPDASWQKQLTSAQHDPERQTLIEIFSGHGNSEEHRDWQPVLRGEQGVTCPPPRDDYEPSCWRAGEIIRARCLEAGLAPDECEARAARARQHYADAGLRGRAAIPGERAEDWLDAGQCRDCFLPAFNYRPANSVQAITALTNFDEPDGPRRFRFGFIASSDVHSGRPGTGYKEFARTSMADQSGPADQRGYDFVNPRRGEPAPESRPVDLVVTSGLNAFQNSEFERQNSFWLTGGLVAVHADARSRDGVWNALARKEVYGTSGDRILLWFDLLNPPGGGGPAPMGSELTMSEAPRFEVRALGAFRQQPGCPEYSLKALSPERIASLCRRECHNPSDQRKRITRIEVVRIRPQAVPGEPLAALIEDPWRRFECADEGAGCRVEFEDPEHATAGRDAVYYARAIEEPSLAVNANNLRCEYDEQGRCVRVRPCWGDFRTPESDECLDTNEERAWSSPIYLDWPRAGSS